MKKRVLSIMLVLILLLQIVPISSMAYPAPSFGAQNATAKFASGKPVVVAHRAAWRDAPECSILAVYNAIQMGVDVFELDIQMSSDGKLVLFHDSSIDRTVSGSSGNASNYTLAQLRAMPLEKNQGNSSAHVLTEAEAQILNSVSTYVEDCGQAQAGGNIYVNTLEDILILMKKYAPNTMINLDKCTSQEKFVATYIMLREYGMLGNVFIKSKSSASTMASWYAAAATAWNAKHPEEQLTAQDVCDSVLYVYVLEDVSTTAISEHLNNNGNLVMVEICIDSDTEDAGMFQTVEPWCKANNVAMFINTMWSGLCSTKEDTETTWAEMLDRGYTAIQTDQPSELSEYLQAYNNGHASTDTIEAEHFHLFNYESYGLKVAEVADSDMNKKVTGMQDGDWMRYEKITFQGGENVLTLNLCGTSNGGSLSVYLDDQTAPIAELALSAGSAYSDLTVFLAEEIEAGTHAVTLKVTGLPGVGLLSVDNFTFATVEFSGAQGAAAVEVSTEVGVAPVMPNTVNVTAGDLTYAMDVSWEVILPESYAETGTFEVLGYVDVLKEYVKATVNVYTITPGIAEENLLVWFDASNGITSSDGAVSEWKAAAGDLTATISAGSPTLVENAIGGEKGIYFDGNDVLTFTLNGEEDFWNRTDAQFTVLMYVSSENVTSGNGTTNSGASVGQGNQQTSVLWFAEYQDAWGGVYFEPSQNEVIWRYGSGVPNDRGSTYVRDGAIGEMFTATAIRKDGAINTLFIDGENVYSNTAQSADTVGTTNVGYIGRGVKNYFKGTVCQILIYDTALTDEQIVAAQRWMAEKYADQVVSAAAVSVNTTVDVAPDMPATVTVTYESGATAALAVEWENIDPASYRTAGTFEVKGTLTDGTEVTATVTVEMGTDLSDWDSMLLWLSAQSLTGTGTVSEWTAMNSNALKFVQNTASKRPTIVTDENGKILGLRFDGSDDMMELSTSGLTDANNPLTAINGLSGVTVVVYSKPEGTAASAIGSNHYSSILYMDETGDWGSLYFGTYTNGAQGRLGTATAKHRGILYNGGSYSDYYTAVLRKNGTSADQLIINGTLISNVKVDSSSSGSVTKNISATKVKLGQGKVKNNDYTMWKGTVSEIMVFSKSLSDAELSEIYVYLEKTYRATEISTVTGIKLKQEGEVIELLVGDEAALEAAVVPSTAANKGLTYASSDADVATVDENGVITAVGTGYAVITVTTAEGGYTASCTVKVSQDPLWISIENIRAWAAAQDESDYVNFSDMALALEQTQNVASTDSRETLAEAYSTLRSAMLALVKAEPVTPAFYSLSLKGNIGVNYYMYIPAYIAADTNGYMEITTPRGGTVQISIADADQKTVDGQLYYRFTATVAAKEMTDVITAQYFYSNGQSEVIRISVQEYAQQILNYEGSDVSMNSAKPLVEAMLRYGAWAQKNFGYNTDNLAAEATELTDITAETLRAFERTGAQGTAQAPLASVSLVLKAETSMRLYFNTTAELTATMDGKALTVVRKSADLCYVEIPNISAKDLDKTFTVEINDGTETAEVSYCPMTYCYNVVNAEAGSVTDEMLNTAKALYLYNQAANDYFQ